MTHDEAVAFLVVVAERNEKYQKELSRSGLMPGEPISPSKYLQVAEMLNAWAKAWDDFRELISVKWTLGINTPETSGLLDNAIREMDARDPRNGSGTRPKVPKVCSCDGHPIVEGKLYRIVHGHGDSSCFLLGPDGSMTLLDGSYRVEWDDDDRECKLRGVLHTVPRPAKCGECGRWFL